MGYDSILIFLFARRAISLGRRPKPSAGANSRPAQRAVSSSIINFTLFFLLKPTITKADGLNGLQNCISKIAMISYVQETRGIQLVVMINLDTNKYDLEKLDQKILNLFVFLRPQHLCLTDGENIDVNCEIQTEKPRGHFIGRKEKFSKK